MAECSQLGFELPGLMGEKLRAISRVETLVVTPG